MFERLARLRQMRQSGKRALEAGHRLPIGRTLERSCSGPVEVHDRFVPDLALEVVKTESQVVRVKIPGVECVEGLGDTAMKRNSTSEAWSGVRPTYQECTKRRGGSHTSTSP